MHDIPISNVRNFIVTGHSGAGKTTLVDAILFKLGMTDRLGSVDDGTSMSDWTDEEKKRKISIAAVPFQANFKSGGVQYNMTFIDTPGYADFYGQVLSAVSVTESALVVVDASAGVQVGTRRVWRAFTKCGINARGIVITGLDKENADFAKALANIQDVFGKRCVPVVFPKTDGSGVIDVLGSGEGAVGAGDEVAAARTALVEMAAETDERLMEKFFAEEPLAPDEISVGLKSSVAAGSLVPVFAAMPKKGIGVSELLEGLVRLFPSPAREIKDAQGVVVDPAREAPFVGFVWKSVIDGFVGQLAVVRVFGGTLNPESEILNATRGQKEKVGQILVLSGKKQLQATQATAGDIVALPKLKGTRVGDTLCAPGHPVVMPVIAYPKPVFFQAVAAKTQADEDKLGTALARLVEEDPTLHVDRNKETKQVVLQGLGDVHIDVAVARMKSQSNVSVDLHTPKIPYRETVTASGEGHYKHKKQSGGRGQYGEVYLRVDRLPEGEEEWFVDAVVGGVIPNNFIPAVQKGLAEGMNSGGLAGFPVEKVRMTLYDGSFHAVDSSEVAFKIAASRAMKDAMLKAKPVLLEPIMTVTITVPDRFMGDINGDMSHRRGRIVGMNVEDGLQSITAEIPMAELFRYTAELRSMTGGQGSFEMAFARYDVVPSNVAQKIIEAAKKPEEEED